ncbi:MAG TPA: ATP-binding protein [Rubrobacteraceae bacterium]|nr:ATP-binding protein [Rubrobacteraceae bacterium]
MPAVAVLIVMLAIGTILLYGLQAVKTRLGEYSREHALAEAAAAATAVESASPDGAGDALKLAVKSSGGEALLVDRKGKVLAREGSGLPSALPQRVIDTAARGNRLNERIEDHRVTTVPVVRGGGLRGGLVFVSDNSESAVLDIFSRSNVEAAAIAAVLGGGLMLLVATLLSRRVERLTLGAKAIERGDFSSRIEPGYGDELGELAETFNAMTAKVQKSMSRLEENNATLDAILDNLNEGVLATDLKGRVMFANLSARRMLGMTSERVQDVRQPEELPDPFGDFDLPDAVARCARRQECGEARAQGDETFFHINLEHMPAFDEHRGGVLVVIRDLSESRRLEANQQRFLANAAHELRTPITTILGASDLLLTEEEDDPRVRERFLKHIRSEAERMQRLSETLLRLARTGWDRRAPNLREVDLGTVAGRVAERMRPLARGAGLTLTVEGEGGRVRADEEWLEQALLVLTSNAVQHSERGGRVRLRTHGPVVTVEDEGVGIEEEDIPHVFERFHRGKDSEGFGLGLPICKELVESMNGEISLSSRKGKGTTIEIKLPEIRARTGPQAATQAATEDQNG